MNYINSVIRITDKAVYDFIRKKQTEMEIASNGHKTISPNYEEVVQKIIEEHIEILKKKK